MEGGISAAHSVCNDIVSIAGLQGLTYRLQQVSFPNADTDKCGPVSTLLNLSKWCFNFIGTTEIKELYF